TDGAEGGEIAADLRNVLEQFGGLADRHLEDVGDRMPAVLDRQRFLVVALAPAGIALDPDVGEEVHLDALLAVPFAVFAPPAGAIEAKPRGAVAADLGLGQSGEQLANFFEDAGVGRRI